MRLQEQITAKQKELEDIKSKVHFYTTGSTDPSVPMRQTSDLNDLKRMNDVVESLRQREADMPPPDPPKPEPVQLIVPDHKLAMESNVEPPTVAYSTLCNADFAPLVCNEFCGTLGSGDKLLDRREAIELVRHMCAWLSREGLTCAILDLI